MHLEIQLCREAQKNEVQIHLKKDEAWVTVISKSNQIIQSMAISSLPSYLNKYFTLLLWCQMP